MGYARPFEGIRMLLDLAREEVIEFVDERHVPVPPRDIHMNYTPTAEMRRDVRPIVITQPEGPSFTVDGYAVNWQKWSLRVGFNGREGLTLHTVHYSDKDRGDRLVAYRLSFAEMVVPY